MKIHYKAIERDNTIVFVPVDHAHQRFSLYWCGGGNGKIPYILQTLIKTHGVEKAHEIFQAYNEALLATSKTNTQSGKPTAVLVKYIKNDHLSSSRKESSK